MVILHYAGIIKNNASGLSVIVPQILNYQSKFAQVGIFNYDGEFFDTAEGVTRISDFTESDDYRTFPAPFNKPDIVVIHSPFGIPKVVMIAKKLKKSGIPYIIVPHGCFSSYAMKKKKLKKTAARIVFLDKMVADATKIQYLSEGEQRASIYRKESFIVPNGIDINPWVEKTLNSDLLVMSFIGRKDLYHKGLDLLIGACGSIKDQIKDKVQIDLYGPACPEHDAQLRKVIADNGVGDFVFHKPSVFYEEKTLVYQNTDVVVLTSRFEGQPVAILEAWSYGVPTLVTPGTNVSEECESNGCGWAVSQNVEAIAQKLLYLIENREEIAKCSKNAYEYVCREYNWNRISDRYREEFLSILKK